MPAASRPASAAPSPASTNTASIVGHAVTGVLSAALWLWLAWHTWFGTFRANYLHCGTAEALMPILAYWATGMLYDLVNELQWPFFERYRVQSRAWPANRITKTAVVTRCALMHIGQFALASLLVVVTGEENVTHSLPRMCVQWVVGIAIIDTWQYWWHRAMHIYPSLYRQFHSVHHRLIMPYALGALYNHPVESFILDMMGSVVAMVAVGMTSRTSAWFLSFVTWKTVSDHSNYRLPWDPMAQLFPNNCAYHDIHHQLKYIKYNFSQPFFVWWDVICGTYIAIGDPALVPPISPADYSATEAEHKADLIQQSPPRSSRSPARRRPKVQ